MARIGNLRIFTDEGVDEGGRNINLPPTSLRYKTVEAFTDLGLRVLECLQGIESLVQVANALLDAFEGSEPPVSTTFKGPRIELPQYVTGFLQKIRADFPAVHLQKSAGQVSTDRFDWGTDVSDYNPRRAGFFIVHRTIVNNMVWISQQSSEITGNHYARYEFEMGLTMAHEIVHLFTGYITGTMYPITPTAVGFAPYAKKNHGEAGNYWEVVLLGGTIEQYINDNDRMYARRQAGVPWLVKEGQFDAEARRISDDYIIDFLAGNFKFPFSTKGRPTTRGELRKYRWETTLLRNFFDKMPGTTSPKIYKSSSKIERQKELEKIQKRLSEVWQRLDQMEAKVSIIGEKLFEDELQLLDAMGKIVDLKKQRSKRTSD